MGQKLRVVKFGGAVSLFFMVTGCTAIGNWFDSVGEHMPVIDERCENWQCFTASGQAASDAKKKQMQQQTQQPKQASPATPPPPAPQAYPDGSGDSSVVRH